ncbi:LITAF domain-containing protein-like [Crassostrea virginica]|uniref:Lipopolysaccharide-induced tumor necrosis factor-alpha factor homolog n=1 Tax=Crassostrea virginica TaxID=6565 RepID=A0A8B8EP05_CRAVI|nr:lipopolysaccharide-induced tumor necrosis factor-alpha factor homolog [Crassostrea virginica]
MEKGGGPPPPPPSYSGPPPPYSGQTTSAVVVTQQTPFVAVQLFRETPVRLKCQYCSSEVITSTSYETGTITWLACAITAFVGCWLGCCFIPFCVDGCKDVVHTCPNCRQVLGRYDRI